MLSSCVVESFAKTKNEIKICLQPNYFVSNFDSSFSSCVPSLYDASRFDSLCWHNCTARNSQFRAIWTFRARTGSGTSPAIGSQNGAKEEEEDEEDTGSCRMLVCARVCLLSICKLENVDYKRTVRRGLGQADEHAKMQCISELSAKVLETKSCKAFFNDDLPLLSVLEKCFD